LEVKYDAVAKTFGLAFRLSVTRLHQQTLPPEVNAARRILARKVNVGKLAEEGKQCSTFSWELPNDLVIHVNSNEEGVPIEGRCEKSLPEMGLNIPHEVPEVIGYVKATDGLEGFVTIITHVTPLLTITPTTSSHGSTSAGGEWWPIATHQMVIDSDDFLFTELPVAVAVLGHFEHEDTRTRPHGSTAAGVSRRSCKCRRNLNVVLEPKDGLVG
jgi:hypothetical protein